MSALDKIVDKTNGGQVTKAEACVIVAYQKGWENLAAEAAEELAALRAENEKLTAALLEIKQEAMSGRDSYVKWQVIYEIARAALVELEKKQP